MGNGEVGAGVLAPFPDALADLAVRSFATLGGCPDRQATVFAAESGHIGLDTFDTLNQIVVSHHFRFGIGNEASLFRSPHRYVWPAELDLMAELAGFTLESRHADWIGSPFTAESGSHISVYRLEG